MISQMIARLNGDSLGQDEISDYYTLKEKEDKLPYVIHYCQNYWLGKWFLGKYRLDSDFFVLR